MDTDRNLLFGLLALQADLLTASQFAEACSAWVGRKETALAELLVERGWLTPRDRADVEKQLQGKLARDQGDVRASLAEVTTDRLRQSLAGVADEAARQTLDPATTTGGAPPGPTPPTPGPPAAPGARFTILRRHAEGGLGRVHLARDEQLRRTVALKEIRPERVDEPQVRERFLAEAEITGQLEHPGIVPIYSLEHDAAGRPVYAMRFIQGRTLARAIRAYHEQPAPLKLRELLQRFIAVCQTLAYAHSRGIIHRDLKPANIMLGDYGETLVVDWGLAKRLGREPTTHASLPATEVRATTGDASACTVDYLPADRGGSDGTPMTASGQVVGTPAYMAPEQARGDIEALGPATDIYALGAILYEILTAQAPYGGTSVAEVLRHVCAGPPPAPLARAAQAPKPLNAVCLRAMARQPSARYATAADLAREVERWLADEPVAAYREPLAVRAARWARRHRTLAAACAAGLLAAVAGLAAVSLVQQRANADLRAANEREQARFNLALDAIKTFHTGVSEDFLLKQDQFKEVSTRLLAGAKDFYGRLEKLLADQPDARSRRALGEAYYQLGEVTAQVGSKPEALAVHRQGLAVRRELAAVPEADGGVRADVARSLQAVGTLAFQTADADAARAALEEARDLADGLAAAEASDELATLQAQCHYGLGSLLAKTGKPSQALSALEKARAIQEALARANPTVTALQSDLGASHHYIGWLLIQTGKPSEALAALEKARAIQ